MSAFWAVLGSFLAAICLAGLAEIRAYVRPRIKSARWRRIFDIADQAAQNSIKHTAQTYTDDIRKKSADGTLTPEERQEAMKRSLMNFEMQLGSEGLLELKRALEEERGISGDAVGSFLKTLLESAVSSHNTQRAKAVGPSAASVAPTPESLAPSKEEAPAPVTTPDQGDSHGSSEK